MDPRKGDRQCAFCYRRPIRNENGVCDECQKHIRFGPKRCICGQPIEEKETLCAACFFDALKDCCDMCGFITYAVDNRGTCPNCGNHFNVQKLEKLEDWLHGKNTEILEIKRALLSLLVEYKKLLKSGE